MGTVIVIFQFLWKVLRAVLSFLISLPGLIFSAIMGIASAVQALVSNVGGCLTKMIEFFDTAQDYVTEMVEFIGNQSYWGFFYELFAIDTFGEVFTYFITFATTLIVLIAFEMLFQGICVAVPFLIYKSIGKILQTVSAGFAKPA